MGGDFISINSHLTFSHSPSICSPLFPLVCPCPVLPIPCNFTQKADRHLDSQINTPLQNLMICGRWISWTQLPKPSWVNCRILWLRMGLVMSIGMSLIGCRVRLRRDGGQGKRRRRKEADEFCSFVFHRTCSLFDRRSRYVLFLLLLPRNNPSSEISEMSVVGASRRTDTTQQTHHNNCLDIHSLLRAPLVLILPKSPPYSTFA